MRAPAHTNTHTHTHVRTSILTHIHTHMDRERERERERLISCFCHGLSHSNTHTHTHTYTHTNALAFRHRPGIPDSIGCNFRFTRRSKYSDPLCHLPLSFRSRSIRFPPTHRNLRHDCLDWDCLSNCIRGSEFKTPFCGNQTSSSHSGNFQFQLICLCFTNPFPPPPLPPPSQIPLVQPHTPHLITPYFEQNGK